MELTSKAIAANETIAKRYVESGCGGDNVSPDLAWSGAPEGTKSFAVTCYDPDAPTGSGFWHWVGFGVDPGTTELGEGGDFPGTEWQNDYGFDGYGGPCPPPGPAHRYIFTVHALDTDDLGIEQGATSAQVRFAIMAHSIDSATRTGLYATTD